MDARIVGALINGLSKQRFHNDAEMTDEFLAEQLFDGDGAALEKMKATVLPLLEAVAAADMDLAKTDAYLTEQGVSEEVSAAFTKFWKKERAGVHEALVKAASWNNKLDSVSWRLDVLTRSRHVDELSNPAAIVEMKIEKVFPTATDVCRFEMDSAKLDEVVAQVEQIEARIEALTA